MPGFAPVAEVGAELFWRVGNCELVRCGFERFAFGEVFSFPGDFAIGRVAHRSITEYQLRQGASGFRDVRPSLDSRVDRARACR